MTKTIKAPRTAETTKTSSEVQTMLLDIATVLRLTAMVKSEMIRDRVEADRKAIESRRAALTAEASVSA
ncbi:MAG: hypothetical protein MUF18_08120 [Fimbriiglobus sp.]|jgi:hypothetical protein|nr:hypothetical protein [Fimbriiglobus sp.]